MGADTEIRRISTILQLLLAIISAVGSALKSFPRLFLWLRRGRK